MKTKITITAAAITSVILWLSVVAHSVADQSFNLRQHLSTVSTYGAVKDVVTNSVEESNLAEGCVPIHLNLVARHGTRSPTKKRIKELDQLASHLEELIRDAEDHQLSLPKLPAWLRGWQSPWKGKLKGGELISKGEKELYDLGIRTRERFPNLFKQEYHPDVYPIKATQVARASASAVAFGIGLFSDKGSLGPGNHRAFSVISESRASDIMLRFHDCCENYKAFRKSQEPAVDKLKEPILDEITAALVSRYGLSFTRKDTSSLWFLCKQEASLLNMTNQACSLFNSSEVALLGWTDDLEVFLLKGYGKSINYHMGVPLLKDVFHSMEQAIKAHEEKHAPGSYEKARLRFAHAETLIPFSCLLGLFLDESEFQKIQRDQPLELPPRPPHNRNWWGSIVAPFAGNNMLVLHSCPADSSSKYLVQVLHNEHPIPMPGCNNSEFCPFEVFKEKIVAPHIKHEFYALCDSNSEKVEKKPETSKLSQLFHWLFSLGRDDTQPSKNEL
ncbi:uncharacterized protein LOC126660804 [Mercurialis annua]|uniref:uncharacterized protein LOC126660804 n=1 Tax=Mercurialis annua TaxID=3986 RepID=UPI00215E4780|nr:uncharacterized protein LOC126660804 [Mercurialis annua]XP_050210442.1 uncharacterized protein LOC126660804 [Mercurialis annua]XP_055959914.1 uncharacterized protein LOC126660804 [Mercurialis annua]